MNSVFAFMNSVLVAVMCLNVLAPRQASAAVCTEKTNFKCVPTDNTMTKCNRTTLVCDCQGGFFPIPTGCAENFNPPTVRLDAGRSNQCLPGATLKLTCFTSEPGTLVYVWKKNGVTLTNENKQELIIPCDKTEVGQYSCSVNDTTLGLYSVPSYEKDIVPFDAATVYPGVSLVPQTAAAGVQLDLQCTNIPYGANYSFRLIPSKALVQTVIQDPVNKQVTCVLNNVTNVKFAKSESNPVTLPTIATDIDSVDITSRERAVVTKTGTSVTFTCVTDPEAKFMETADNKIVYKFQDTGNASASPVGNTYTLTFGPGNTTPRNLSCSASYMKNPEKKSIVSFSDDNNMAVPVLIASSTTVSPGDRLLLTCITDRTNYITWFKDGKSIPRETDHTIQFGNFQDTDAGKYVCALGQSYYFANSTEVNVRSNAQELRVLSSAVTVLAAAISWRVL